MEGKCIWNASEKIGGGSSNWFKTLNQIKKGASFSRKDGSSFNHPYKHCANPSKSIHSPILPFNYIIKIMSQSAFVFSFLLANSLIFCIQGFLFPPSMAGGCSCPPAQCPSAPTAHCIWKRQAGGEEDENAMVSLVEEEGEPERIDDGGDAGGSAGSQAAFGDGGIGQENPQMEGGDEDGMAMVYDDDLASSAATEKTVTLAQKQSTNTLPSENVDGIGERTLASTLQTSSAILPSSSDSAPSNTSTTTDIPIGTFPPINGAQSIEKGKGKQEKVPLTKGKGKSGTAAKIVPEKAAGNNSGAGQTSTKNGATSRNCNSELMRQIMLEHINLKPTIAKRQIQAQVSAQVGGRIDVVCAKKAFSYIVNSELFCEVEKDGTVCLCYRQQ